MRKAPRNRRGLRYIPLMIGLAVLLNALCPGRAARSRPAFAWALARGRALVLVLAGALAGAQGLPAMAQSGAETRLDALLAELGQPDLPNWRNVEEEIWQEWSRSGSAAMDLLLERGKEALEADDLEAAIGHFTALADHAPGFAEGYNARALAYFTAGLYGPALADLERVLALEPRHFGALAGVGAILSETGREGAALSAYRAARAIHPHDPDLEEAEARLSRALMGETL